MSSTTSTLAATGTPVAGTVRPLQRVFATSDSLAPTIARLALGLVMFPHGAQKGEGYEYHLLVLALALIVLVWGGGKASVDRRLARA